MLLYIYMRSYKKKSSSIKRKTYKKYVKRPVSLAVKKFVQRSIKVASENKVVNWSYNAELFNFNATGSQWYTYNFHQLSPNVTNLVISQGVGQGQRIGNNIKTVKAILKFAICPNPYNATSNPTVVPTNIRIIIFSSKNHPVQIPPFSQFQNHLFQAGNSSNGPLNNLMDQLNELNRDIFTIHYDKMIKVGNAWNSLVQATPQGFNNNDYKLNVMRKINITKYLPKVYQYNDTTNNPTSGRSVYVMFIQSNAEGTPQNSIALQNKIFMDVDYHYEE